MTEETEAYDGTVWRKGEKVILRPLVETDAADLQKWVNNPTNNCFLSISGPIGIGFELEWVKKNQAPSQTDIVVAVCTHDGTLIGVMGLHSINQVHGTATTGANIGHPDYQGKGYGTDAKMLLLDYAFNWLRLNKVCTRVIAYNGRSTAYSRKCGYVEEGVLKHQWFRLGTYHDEVLMAVFADEWRPLWEKYREGLPHWEELKGTLPFLEETEE